MKKNIALIPGDGIGPEIMAEAKKVLDAVAERFSHEFSYTQIVAGGCAIDQFQNPLPQKSLDDCLSSDAVLLASVGGPKWDNVDASIRPEKALLGLRSGLGTYANLRPAKIFPQLASSCPLKNEIVKDSIDILIVRELTGGMYFGKRGRSPDGKEAFDTEIYSDWEIERILKVGFESSLKRRKKLCLVDKANILESSRLWREIAKKMSVDYPQVELSFMYVDNAAMQLVRNPSQFDVIVTSNMFGDILSDEASQITGSIGMLPSASLGESGPALFEPIHGSAPDIAGKGCANPLAMILSCAMLLRYGFNMDREADLIEESVEKVLDEGYRTFDIAGSEKDVLIQENKLIGTVKMGDLVVSQILHK